MFYGSREKVNEHVCSYSIIYKKEKEHWRFFSHPNWFRMMPQFTVYLPALVTKFTWHMQLPSVIL